MGGKGRSRQERANNCLPKSDGEHYVEGREEEMKEGTNGGK